MNAHQLATALAELQAAQQAAREAMPYGHLAAQLATLRLREANRAYSDALANHWREDERGERANPIP